MVQADTYTLERIIERRLRDSQLHMDLSDFFEIYVPSQVLKPFALSYEEINLGIVDGHNDGGIDGMYTFVNGILVTDDTDLNAFGRDIHIDLAIFQTKYTSSFTENAVDRIISSTLELVQPNADLDALRSSYNSAVLEQAGLFQRAQDELLTLHPSLSVRVYYATKGTNVDPKVERRSLKFKNMVESLFSNCDGDFTFLTSTELLDLDSKPLLPTLSLEFTDAPISTTGDGFLGLVLLSKYYGFITDEGKQLRNAVFDSNVRDYQGEIEVNRSIRSGLDQSLEDFWWLNNGITIISTNATQSGRTLTVSDPQIVNGLQTSVELYRHFSTLDGDAIHNDKRRLLVRILVTEDEESRDRIITATNSQTRIPAASLRASDPVQRRIEQHFLARGLYYDRRKNHHRIMGRPASKIVTIPYLAQSVMAILLQKPDSSRARPSNIIKADNDYRLVFNNDRPLDSYFAAAKVMRRIDEFMRLPAAIRAAGDRNNVKWHLAMAACCKLIGKSNISDQDIIALDLTALTEDFLIEQLDLVWTIFQSLIDTNTSADRVAKSRQFVRDLEVKLEPASP